MKKSYFSLIILYLISLLIASSFLIDYIIYVNLPEEIEALTSFASALAIGFKLIASLIILSIQLPLFILIFWKKDWYLNKKIFRIFLWIMAFVPVYLLLWGMYADCFIDDPQAFCLDFRGYYNLLKPSLPSLLKP